MAKDTPLEQLLSEAGDESQQASLRRAWEALQGLTSGESGTPQASPALARIFTDADGPMSDHELDLLAAAGDVAAPDFQAPEQILSPDAGGEDKPVPPRGWGAWDMDEEDDRALYQEDQIDDLPAQGRDQLLDDVTDEPEKPTDVQMPEGDVFVLRFDCGDLVLEDFDPGKDRLQIHEALDDLEVETTPDGDTLIRSRQSTVTLRAVALTREDIHDRLLERD